MWPIIISEYYTFNPTKKEFVCNYREEKKYHECSRNSFANYFGPEQLSEQLEEQYRYREVEKPVPNQYKKIRGNSIKQAEFRSHYVNDPWRYIFTIEGENNIVQFRINKEKNSEIRIGRKISEEDYTAINELLKNAGYFLKKQDDENGLKRDYLNGKMLSKSIEIDDIIDTKIDLEWLLNIIQYAKEQGVTVDEEQFKALRKIREENQKTQADE